MLKELIEAGFAAGNAWDNMVSILSDIDRCLNDNDIEGAKRHFDLGMYYARAQQHATGLYLRMLKEQVCDKKPTEEPK